MAKSPIWTLLGVGALFVQAAAFPVAGAHGLECKRKAAGFYLEETEANRPHKLFRTVENLPGSLTGAPGNPEAGRAVFIGAQKGACASCHRLSALPTSVGQGTIGPALDGTGSKYDEGQFRQMLLQPGTYFPRTIMPAYYRVGDGADSVLTASEIEDLVAYLGTLK